MAQTIRLLNHRINVLFRNTAIFNNGLAASVIRSLSLQLQAGLGLFLLLIIPITLDADPPLF